MSKTNQEVLFDVKWAVARMPLYIGVTVYLLNQTNVHYWGLIWLLPFIISVVTVIVRLNAVEKDLRNKLW